MADPLAGLDDVPWDRLGHAYGPATDVPGLLRDLLSHEVETRDHAMSELWGNIWHQNSVYEATQHAVPFLIRLLETTAAATRAEILVLLASIANGRSYHDVHQHVSFLAEKAKTEEWQAAIRQELVWVAEARGAVAQGSPVYVGLLRGDPDAQVRSRAAYVLANVVGEDEAAERALSERLTEETDEVARASALRALSCATSDAARARCVDRLVRHFEGEAAPYAKLSAAMGLVVLAPDRLDAAARAGLVRALVDPGPLEPIHRSSPWANASLPADLAPYVVRAGRGQPDGLVPLLENALRGADSWSALTLVEALFQLTFPEAPAPGMRYTQLPPLQQGALRTLLDSPKAWVINANLGGTLRAFGLPSWIQAMRLFVEGGATLGEACRPRAGMAPAPAPSSSDGFWARLRRWFSGGRT